MRKMKTLLYLSAFVLADDLLNDDSGFHADFESKPDPLPKVAFKVSTYKGAPSTTCTAGELCDASADLSNWSPVEDQAHYDGQWEVREHAWLKGKKQLVMKDEMKFYGLSRPVTPWSADKNESLAFSMTARFAENHNCGGAYVKLYTRENEDTHNLTGKTPYSIMFGPDRCGVSTRKIHWIAQYTDTADQRIEEHLSTVIDLPTDMSRTHQYSFVVTPKDGGWLQIFVDGQVVQEGKLKELTKPGWRSADTIDDPTDTMPEDWTPPARMIPDPNAEKPEDWDDDEPETIEDMDAEMPEDWLEEEPDLVPNPNAEKPEGWDDEEDGEWIRPMMKNPKCQGISGCGVWKRPIIPNPKFKGAWSAPMVPNPDYTDKYPTRQIPHPKPYDLSEPFKNIEQFNSMGFEIWSVQAGTTLDNFMLTTDPAKMQSWSKQAFAQLSEVEEENYKLISESKNIKDMPDTDTQDSKRYMKIAGAVLICGAVILVAARKLFGQHFRASDSPVPPASADTKENSAPTKAPVLETSETSTGVQDTKKGEEAETEPTVGETKPKMRAAA